MSQQQIFTKDFIFTRIKDSNAPYWNLSLCQGFKNIANVMNYNGIDFDDEDTEETKQEKSIQQLARTIDTFPPDSVFVIELRGAMTSNRSGIFGPFQFSNTDRPAQPETPPAAATPTLGTIPQGYVPESMLKGLQDQLQSNFDAQIKALKEEQALQRREDDYNRRMEELAEAQKEVKEMKKSYDSTVAKGTDILLGALQRLGAMFLAPKGAPAAMMAQMQQPQLGATQQQPQLGATQQPKPDPKMDAVDDLSEYIYNNFTTEQITQMKSNLIASKNVPQLETATGANTVATGVTIS